MKIKEYAKSQPERFDFLSPAAMLVLCDFLLWCKDRSIRPYITDTVTDLSEDMALNRVSSTHREGRAFDVSTKGWPQVDIDDCVRIFGQRYRYLAAIRQDGNPRLVYFHDAGTGQHLHFQVHKRYAMSLKQFNSVDSIQKLP